MTKLLAKLEQLLPCWKGETNLSEISSGESGESPSDNKQSWTLFCRSLLFNNLSPNLRGKNDYNAEQVALKLLHLQVRLLKSKRD